MKTPVNFLQITSIHVRIDLSGTDIGVTKHFLHSSQVCTAFEKMSGKRMAQCVWTHLLIDPSAFG
jgi:hypothetical protein